MKDTANNETAEDTHQSHFSHGDLEMRFPDGLASQTEKFFSGEWIAGHQWVKREKSNCLRESFVDEFHRFVLVECQAPNVCVQ
jgi:hypothetical protein